MRGSQPIDFGIPVLETKRLRMRSHILADFVHTKAVWSDPAVVTFMGARPFTEEECWARFLRYLGLWAALGFGYWVVEEKSTGDFVGEVGFGVFKRDMVPSLGDAPELGWALAPAQHGKGYATEAAQAAIQWGREHFTDDMVCIIHPEHSASINVASKCGFQRRTLSSYRGQPSVIFTLPVKQDS
jgi:RimJ/RimL family protein N-acetyltransferase